MLNLEKQALKSTTGDFFIRTALCLIGCALLFSGVAQGCFIVGDLDGDCQVGMDDLILMATQWMGPSCGPETGLILHWRLNEAAGTEAADASGSGYAGYVAGASWNPAGGTLGGALQFDGIDDYAATDPNIYTGIDGSNPRTCAAWIKTGQPSGEIMSWGLLNPGYDAHGWLIWVDESGALRVDVGGGYVMGTTVLTDDQWHHIAVSSDGSTTDQIVLYVDGKSEAIGEVVSQSIQTWGVTSVMLGNYSVTNRFFDGLIDDARIYDRVLSLQEVWAVAETATTLYDCADLNTDQNVNLSDIALISQNWGDYSPLILINEFLTDNQSKSQPGDILDGNGESSDWIEIYNNSATPVDISGWYLTDDADLKTKWQFPTATVLPPGDYRIIFASDKTQAQNPGNYPYVDPAGYLHTNFQLSSNGEYLALIDADGTTPIHQYNHVDLGGGEWGYPAQETDISYGRYYDQTGYLSQPTPGTDNIKSSFDGFIEKPDVNTKGGCYQSAVDVTLSCGTEGAFVRYTTDGSVPSLTNGLDYTGPLHIDSLTGLIAKAFKPGFQPSDARIETYIFVEPAVADFDSNLPIIVVDTNGQEIIDNPNTKPYTECQAVIIDTDAVTGRAEITGPEHFAGLGQIRFRGESSYNLGRHFAFETLDEYRQDKAVSLLRMPAESDWIITGEVYDYTKLKSHLAFKWFRDMGHYATRDRFVEMYLNEDGGLISQSDYRGLFILREKIKRNDDRVDIARIDASHNLDPLVSGGYIVKNDKADTGDTVLNLETAPYGIVLDGVTSVVEPGPTEITTPQINWIRNFMNEFHAVLWQNPSSSYYPGSGFDYTDYVEQTSWIDHGIVEEIGFDADAFRFSYFIHKDRNGKLCSGPPWDFDLAFHNNGLNGSYGSSYTGWDRAYKLAWAWHSQLFTYPEYALMFADRWFEHRETVLNTPETMTYIDEQVALISEAMSRTYSLYSFPYPYTQEINNFKTWITNRLNFMDGYIASNFAEKPPIISPAGGYVNLGEFPTMTLPSGVSGDIYYTLNGEDPRTEGGALNPNAQLYSGSGEAITETVVDMSAAIWKYLYDGSNQATAWRAYGFDDSSWGSGPGQLGFGDNDEATNIGPKVSGRRTAYFRHKFTVLNVSEITAIDVDLVYDDGAVVYINDQEVDRIHMPTGTIDYNTLSDGSGGDNATTVFSGSDPSVFLVEGDNILAIEVHQDKDNSSDISFDLSLETTRPFSGFDKSTSVKARIKDGSDWTAMNKEVYAVGPVLENLRITELMYHPTDLNTEFIEVQNIGTEPINLNLVHFTDGVDFAFGDYTLPAGGYALVVEDVVGFETKYGTGLPIAGQYLGALDNGGEEIVLRDAVGAEIHDFDYKDGWYELTDGVGYSLTMVDPASPDPNLWDAKFGWRSSLYVNGTPGQAPETALAADSIVINEVLAHSHGAEPDWIELHNTTTNQDIDISGWFLTDDDSDPSLIKKYQIPDNTIIFAGTYRVFVGDTSFDVLTPIGNNVSFGLSEGGETVYLYSGAGGEVTGFYQTQQKFDASESEVTFGRYEKTELSGGYDFVRQLSPSQGLINNGPLIPDIVITEIHYNPPAGVDYEFVELYNRTGSDVTLETEVTTETLPGVFVTEDIPWRLEGTGYEFPAGVTIPAHSYILVVKTPATYSSAPCDVYGPYDGKLDNGGEEVQLQIPGDQEYGEDRYWIPIEKIDYDDIAPWPTTPDGGGDSLQRDDINAYGRDYSNWNAATPTPGN